MTLCLTRLHRLCALALMVVVVSSIVGCGGEGNSSLARSASAEDAVSVSQAGLRGDLNGSGTPDVADAIGILRIVVGLDANNPLADCDGNGTVGVADAIMLLRCVVGLDDWPIDGEDPVLGDEMTGPDGQTLVWVPAGSFMMGSENEWAGVDERPVHRVTLDGFWIGQCEVTNAQYQAFCDATGRAFPSGSDQGDDHPVVGVSWYDAKEYCDHYGYALPTEAQWEYAARGPAAPGYPWGDTWHELWCCNWYNKGPGGETFPVGSFPAGASWWGALDMAGNVWEWCADRYSSSYYQISPELNPPGPESGTYWVLRGGAWGSDDGFCRAGYRNCDYPSFTFDYLGFRVSRSRL